MKLEYTDPATESRLSSVYKRSETGLTQLQICLGAARATLVGAVGTVTSVWSATVWGGVVAARGSATSTVASVGGRATTTNVAKVGSSTTGTVQWVGAKSGWGVLTVATKEIRGLAWSGHANVAARDGSVTASTSAVDTSVGGDRGGGMGTTTTGTSWAHGTTKSNSLGTTRGKDSLGAGTTTTTTTWGWSGHGSVGSNACSRAGSVSWGSRGWGTALEVLHVPGLWWWWSVLKVTVVVGHDELFLLGEDLTHSDSVLLCELATGDVRELLSLWELLKVLVDAGGAIGVAHVWPLSVVVLANPVMVELDLAAQVGVQRLGIVNGQ